MKYLVSVDHNSIAVQLTSSECDKKCCISNVVVGTTDDMLCNGSEEDGNVRSECEGDEGTDCEDGDSDIDW